MAFVIMGGELRAYLVVLHVTDLYVFLFDGVFLTIFTLETHVWKKGDFSVFFENLNIRYFYAGSVI